MSERFSKLFTYEENTYIEGSPLIIAAGALLNDNVTNQVVAQLKFKSVSEKAIKALTVELGCFDTAGREKDVPVKHQYLDLNVNIGDEFGSKQPILMRDNTVRSFKARITEVVSVDNSVWIDTDGVWEPLPEKTRKNILEGEKELAKQFEITYKAGYTCDFDQHKDLWYCPCGAINRGGNCYKCGIEQNKAKVIDYGSLKIESAQRAEMERLKREDERKKHEAQEKKTKRVVAFLIASVSAIIAFVIVLTTVIIPNSKYNDAIALMEKGKLTKAYDILSKLDGYKDSTEKMQYIEREMARELLKNAKVGDCVKFGKYYDSYYGSTMEDIEWVVLEVKDKKALLISKYVILASAYSYNTSNVKWETSIIRGELNGSFFNTAFASNEQNIISETVVAPDSDTNNDVNNGNSTKDKIFILSASQVKKYFPTEELRECKPSERVYDGGLSVGAGGNCFWWLRTTESLKGKASYVNARGDIHELGRQVSQNLGVRPAMWIELED